ncbi:MAG: S1 RNA-binding domain-containing protein [Spirochaetia bacterium]|nr:S1 RNA-binding domain-containing protein [Spirochaetia bacterium]
MTLKTATPFDLDQKETKSMEDMLGALNGQGDFQNGDLIEAVVSQTDEREVYLDAGGKTEGSCPISEFPEPPVAGTRVTVVIVSRGGDQAPRFSRKLAEQRKAWEDIREAFNSKARLSGKILKGVDHGFIVSVGGLDLFMPMSLSGLRPNKGLAVGQEVEFKILEIKEKNHSAIVSHRAILEEKNEALWADLVTKCAEGDVITGKVVRRVSYGLFVDIHGVEGLVHQSDVSYKKNVSLRDRFPIGSELQVKILKMDREHNRLSLGVKQLTEDPWEWARRELKAGEQIEGTIMNVTGYGAFLEIKEGLEGLIHVSDLTWSGKRENPSKLVEPGKKVTARVLSVDFDNKRISLGLKQLEEDPFEALTRDLKVGDTADGVITSITKFGAFVRIRDGVDGLIRFSDYSHDEPVDKKMLSKEQKVTFKVLELDRKRRKITCGLKQLTPGPYEVLKKKYKKGEVLECTVKTIAPFGIFVDFGEKQEGLVHISRIPLPEGKKLEDQFKPGDKVKAALLRIDSDEKRISLSIQDYERKNERDLMNQYMKKEDAPSTSSLGSYMKHLNLK